MKQITKHEQIERECARLFWITALFAGFAFTQSCLYSLTGGSRLVAFAYCAVGLGNLAGCVLAEWVVKHAQRTRAAIAESTQDRRDGGDQL